MQCPIAPSGTASFCGNVDDATPLDVVEAVVVVVVADVVVVGGVVVVVVAAEPGVMTNPQPRAGSFNVNGSETGCSIGTVALEGVGVVVVVAGVVVVVVALMGVVVVSPVVDVGGVVVDVGGVFFVTSRPIPVKTRASNTTRRTNRSGHRRAEGVFRDAGTLRDGNSQSP